MDSEGGLRKEMGVKVRGGWHIEMRWGLRRSIFIINSAAGTWVIVPYKVFSSYIYPSHSVSGLVNWFFRLYKKMIFTSLTTDGGNKMEPRNVHEPGEK